MNVNGLQLFRGKKFAGLTDSNNLAQAYLTEPELVNNVLSFVFGYQYKNPLAMLTGGIGKTRFVQNREYDWLLSGDIEKPIRIVRNPNPSNTTPGLNGQPFQVVLAEKEFVSGEVLIPDSRDYPVIVIGDAQTDGDGFIYTLQLLDSDPTKFLPLALLSTDKEFSKDYSAYEEGSARSGTTTYNTGFRMRNCLNLQRKNREITGSAASDVMVVSMTDPKSGKSSKMWADIQHWTFLEQWYREQERAYIYSKYNAKANGTVGLKGENGRPVYTSAGLREQISPSNKYGYTRLTRNIIQDFMMDLSYNVRGMGDRKFVALCGEGFMSEFDNAMRLGISGWSLIDTHFVTGSGQDLTLGGQFTTYKGVNGVEMTLMHMPLYDDVVHNRELNTLTGRPLEYYRATFIDIGQYDGSSNMVKVAKEGREQIMWTVGGSTIPGGGSGSENTVRSNSVDGYTVEVLAETGIYLKNPLSCGELYMEASLVA